MGGAGKSHLCSLLYQRIRVHSRDVLYLNHLLLEGFYPPFRALILFPLLLFSLFLSPSTFLQQLFFFFKYQLLTRYTFNYLIYSSIYTLIRTFPRLAPSVIVVDQGIIQSFASLFAKPLASNTFTASELTYFLDTLLPQQLLPHCLVSIDACDHVLIDSLSSRNDPSPSRLLRSGARGLIWSSFRTIFSLLHSFLESVPRDHYTSSSGERKISVFQLDNSPLASKSSLIALQQLLEKC